MDLNRKDETFKLNNLPMLKSNWFAYGGRKGYTGSLIKRPVKGRIGLYLHTGLIYGYDVNNTLWIIENNFNGIECVTLRDFDQGLNFNIECNKDPFSIETIMSRVYERVSEKYNETENNGEHFTTYCLTGIQNTLQFKNTEAFADTLISMTEIYLVGNSVPSSILDSFAKIRKTLNLDRHESIEKMIREHNTGTSAI